MSLSGLFVIVSGILSKNSYWFKVNLY